MFTTSPSFAQSFTRPLATRENSSQPPTYFQPSVDQVQFGGKRGKVVRNTVLTLALASMGIGSVVAAEDSNNAAKHTTKVVYCQNNSTPDHGIFTFRDGETLFQIHPSGVTLTEDQLYRSSVPLAAASVAKEVIKGKEPNATAWVWTMPSDAKETRGQVYRLVDVDGKTIKLTGQNIGPVHCELPETTKVR